MILKLLLTILLLYYIGVLWKYYRSDLAGLLGKDGMEEREKDVDEKPQATDEPYTVIGKSTYRAGESDDNVDSHTPENDTGDPMDNGPEQAETTADDDNADYSDIEVEPEEDKTDEEDYVPTPEEMEEEEELGAYYPDGNPDFATGYTFEDLKKVHRIMVTDDVNEEEKREAREVLPAVMGSDVWDAMLDEFEGARQRVARLMNNNNV